MSRRISSLLLAAGLAAGLGGGLATTLAAAPDLAGSFRAGPLEVFPDHRDPRRFFYPPRGLELVREESGRPAMILLQARYLGTGAGGDRGVSVARSVLSFQVALEGASLEEREEARAALGRRLGGGRVELRPMALERIETALIFAPVEGAGEGVASSQRALPAGDFAAEEAPHGEPEVENWSERRFALRLDPATAQLLVAALERGQALFSLGYAFFVRGVNQPSPVLNTSGSPLLAATLRARIALRESSSVVAEGEHLLVSGTTSMAVDLARWPGLVQRVDLNERLPPGYAALDVYCFDFRDRLRPELAVKRVQIEAVGAAGGAVRREALFEASSPELSLVSVRFPFAVRLDRPYRYRVIELYADGRVAEGPWRAGESWEALLEVTGGVEVDDGL